MEKKEKPSLVIEVSPINSWGIFADRDFAPGEVVLKWEHHADFAVFLNHSCNPSCYTEEPIKNHWGHDILFAGSEGLIRGQEVTFDYRKTRWQVLWERTVNRRCGCSECREKGEALQFNKRI